MEKICPELNGVRREGMGTLASPLHREGMTKQFLEFTRMRRIWGLGQYPLLMFRHGAVESLFAPDPLWSQSGSCSKQLSSGNRRRCRAGCEHHAVSQGFLSFGREGLSGTGVPVG